MSTLQPTVHRHTVSDNNTMGSESVPKRDHQGPSSTPNDDRPPNDPHRGPNTTDIDTISTTVTPHRQYTYTDDETYIEGEILLETFVDEQISRSGIIPSEGCETPRTTHRRVHSANINSAGRELRRMADAFELTYERQKVKDKANEIGLGVRTYAEFRELLSALFNPGGITQSRIIVLFFFCSDVAIRSLKAGIDLFKRFMQWSFQYFAERVCDWVRKNGGWVAVLRPQNFYPRVVVAAAAVIVVCAVVYKFVKK